MPSNFVCAQEPYNAHIATYWQYFLCQMSLYVIWADVFKLASNLIKYQCMGFLFANSIIFRIKAESEGNQMYLIWISSES